MKPPVAENCCVFIQYCICVQIASHLCVLLQRFIAAFYLPKELKYRVNTAVLSNILRIALAPIRFVMVLGWALVGLATQLLIFTWCRPAARSAVSAFWAKGMLFCLGVQLYASSKTHPHTTALIVANHISWLDILVLLATAPVVFVAKSEIRSWPVLGWMVALAGTCFIDRSRRSALRSVYAAISQHLHAGQSVAIFPEGTTSDGTGLLPFHTGLFEAAISVGVPVQPIRLVYNRIEAAFIGDQTLANSVLTVLLTPNITVAAVLCPAIKTLGLQRQSVCDLAFTAIENAATTKPLKA